MVEPVHPMGHPTTALALQVSLDPIVKTKQIIAYQTHVRPGQLVSTLPLITTALVHLMPQVKIAPHGKQ